MGCAQSRCGAEANAINNSDTDIEEHPDPHIVRVNPDRAAPDPNPEIDYSDPTIQALIPEFIKPAAPEPDPEPEPPKSPKFQGHYIPNPTDPALHSDDRVSPTSMEPTQREIKEAQKEKARKIAAEDEAARAAVEKEKGMEEAWQKYKAKKEFYENELREQEAAREAKKKEEAEEAATREAKGTEVSAELARRHRAQLDEAYKKSMQRKLAEKEAAEKKAVLEASNRVKSKTADRSDNGSGSGGKEDTKSTNATKPEHGQGPSGKAKRKMPEDDKSAKDRMDSKTPKEESQQTRTNLDGPFKFDTLPSSKTNEDDPSTQDTLPSTTTNEQDASPQDNPPTSPQSPRSKPIILPHRPKWIKNKQRRLARSKATNPGPTQEPSLLSKTGNTTITILDPSSNPRKPKGPQMNNAMTSIPPEDFRILAPPDNPDAETVVLRICPCEREEFPEADYGVSLRVYLSRGEGEVYDWGKMMRGALKVFGVEYGEVGDVYYHTTPPQPTKNCACDVDVFAMDVEAPANDQPIWLHLRPQNRVRVLIALCLLSYKDRRIFFDSVKFLPCLAILAKTKGEPFSALRAAMCVLGFLGLEWSDIAWLKFHYTDDDTDCDPKELGPWPKLLDFSGEIWRQR